MRPETRRSGLPPHSRPAKYSKYSSGLRSGGARSCTVSGRIFALGAFLMIVWLGAANGVRAQDASVQAAQDGGVEMALVVDAGALVAFDLDASVADGAVAAFVPEPEEPLPAAHQPRLRLEVTPREGLMTGDLVHVSLRADALVGDDVTVPQQSFAPFEAHAKRARVEPARDGRQTYVFELDLLALEPGDHTLPAMRIRVVTADGTVGSVKTDPVQIRIRSVLGNEPDAQPKPATQPVLVTFLVVRWWSRRAKPALPPPPARPPWDVALEKLDAVRREARQLLTDGRERELVSRVSDALREYLGGRYGFDGLESTTDEILARLKNIDVRGVSREEIAALLGDSDLVKFAKAVPDESQCEAILAGTYRVVRATAGGGPPPPQGVQQHGPQPPVSPQRGPAQQGAQYGAPSSAQMSSAQLSRAPMSQSAAPPVEGEDDARVITQTDGSLVVTMMPRSAFSVSRALEPAVQAAVGEHAQNINFSGKVNVFLAPELPDDAGSRSAILGALARLSITLSGARTARGMRLLVTVEHFHETPQTAATPPRKSVYEMPPYRGPGGPR
jgi:hypothetical protein